MSYYLCRNGHLIKDKFRAGRECWRCRANNKRRRDRLIQSNRRRTAPPATEKPA